jgi:hypothetical protein
MTLAEKRLETAQEIGAILELVDEFFLSPTDDNEQRALQRLADLPPALQRYKEQCVGDGFSAILERTRNGHGG